MMFDATIGAFILTEVELLPTANVLDISVCALDAGPFSTESDNEFFPMSVGRQWIYEGEEDGAMLRVEITVLDETEVVGGVTTRIIEERESEDGEIVEISRNFFAQAPDGTVCYFGEDVDDFEDGVLTGHGGQWRAGENGSLPGIIMPADPEVGQIFRQEEAPGVALDTGEIIAEDEVITVPAGTFSDTRRINETSPLDNGINSDKVWAAEVGLIIDDVLQLVSFSE